MEKLQNLLEVDPVLPLPRRVNGFRLVPEFYAPLFGDYRVYWYLIPNRFDRKFCFRDLFHAEEFAKRYKNVHSFQFWSRVWCPVYSLSNVQNFI